MLNTEFQMWLPLREGNGGYRSKKKNLMLYFLNWVDMRAFLLFFISYMLHNVFYKHLIFP